MRTSRLHLTNLKYHFATLRARILGGSDFVRPPTLRVGEHFKGASHVCKHTLAECLIVFHCRRLRWQVPVAGRQPIACLFMIGFWGTTVPPMAPCWQVFYSYTTCITFWPSWITLLASQRSSALFSKSGLLDTIKLYFNSFSRFVL